MAHPAGSRQPHNEGFSVLPAPSASGQFYEEFVTWREGTASELAEEIGECLEQGEPDAAKRLAFRFLERFDKNDWEARHRMAAETPPTTGGPRFDALLAGIVEYAFSSHGAVPPPWVDEETFFLTEWWFVSGMASLHANALVHSPISLARRGVFITQGALEYA
jgi:hypothetical protein